MRSALKNLPTRHSACYSWLGTDLTAANMNSSALILLRRSWTTTCCAAWLCFGARLCLRAESNTTQTGHILVWQNTKISQDLNHFFICTNKHKLSTHAAHVCVFFFFLFDIIGFHLHSTTTLPPTRRRTCTSPSFIHSFSHRLSSLPPPFPNGVQGHTVQMIRVTQANQSKGVTCARISCSL